ncbi:hypothetical protein AQJ43_31630 [Streptomyces avermitilis]|uniref:Uncharacterized protein n=3 Tax=Streptomyces avermitilis TaxID=33903 RepID=Q82Q64_STRAW|nr:hypothetical protein [Streptomyces avermitilis]KUN50773.1 hypothetical protein AQJ43_31630 [Streptomyces avermitilis]OOV21746.1 hypothetical protein SM007_32735 [Streptomyces avermitilis]BAC68367.1 hypothetical protein SAVERM_657 [Streptomyces avermitilis MA-4680 = NBRC 14893]BBJ48202.1 hypothetical protein SAVMC3_08310 [Streptomyces avermitilis]GDY69433.1 hypothetical protein SAV14893_088260 [Streptomyces avermitilis]
MMSAHGARREAGHVSGIQAGRDVRIEQSMVALGRATVTGTQTPAEHAEAVTELCAAVGLLLDELRRNEEYYEDGAELVAAAEQVQTELARDEPRRNILLRWLGFIAPGVHATAAVAADLTMIQEGVNALF